jgi:hypothetical protein
MRLAFVLRLGNDSRPAKGLLEGWVEEVDTCTELRFRSTEQLLKFLCQRLELVIGPSGKSVANESESTPTERQPCRKRKSRRDTLC